MITLYNFVILKLNQSEKTGKPRKDSLFSAGLQRLIAEKYATENGY